MKIRQILLKNFVTVNEVQIEAEKTVVYEQRRELGYVVKQLHGAVAECGDVEEATRIDIKELLDKKKKLRKDNDKNLELAQDQREKLYIAVHTHNKKQNALQNTMNAKEAGIKIVKERMVELREKFRSEEEKLAVLRKELTKMPKAEPLLSTDIPLPEYVQHDMTSLDETIEKAQEQNRKAVAWSEFKDLKQKHEKAVANHEVKDTEYKELEKKRVEYLKSCDLPFSNVTINDKGELNVDGRPFCSPYFSKGEILRAGINLAAARNSDLKYIFVPDAQSIDEASREVLFAELVGQGFQVVAEMVGTKKKNRDNSILLRGSRVVESYKNTKNVL